MFSWLFNKIHNHSSESVKEHEDSAQLTMAEAKTRTTQTQIEILKQNRKAQRHFDTMGSEAQGIADDIAFKIAKAAGR